MGSIPFSSTINFRDRLDLIQAVFLLLHTMDRKGLGE